MEGKPNRWFREDLGSTRGKQCYLRVKARRICGSIEKKGVSEGGKPELGGKEAEERGYWKEVLVGVLLE